MDYDTFYTVQYKGYYIHAKYNRTLNREEFNISGFNIPLKSLLSAKQRITKIIGHKTRL